MDICYIDSSEKLCILDQTLLPNEERYLYLQTADEIAEAIQKLRVRGAPLIGIAAAMGLYVSTRHELLQGNDFENSIKHCYDVIASSRPTAVNLRWALDNIMSLPLPIGNDNLCLEQMKEKALLLQKEEESTFEKIGDYGNTLIKDNMGILTHCNAGFLATGGRYGTALAPIYKACEEGKRLKVYADETRPLLQGARLTAFELTHRGIETTLICDNMAATVMSQGKIQIVLVGCDRVAKNGDTANKIGTYGVAIMAKHFGIPFYVCGPSSTFDPHTPTGKDITIELRDEEEIRSHWYEKPMTPKECHIFNPAFDVTPHELITGYITEKGIITKL